MTHPILAVLFALVGIVLLSRGFEGVVIAIGAFVIAAGLARGPRSIKIALADGDKQSIQISRFRSAGAEAFVDALRGQLFKNATVGGSGSTPRWG